MKFLLILIASVLFLGTAKEKESPLPTVRDKQQEQPDTQQKISEPSPPIKEIKIGSEPKTDATKNQPQYWHEWFWPPVWSNWALVIIAAIAGRIALRTLSAIDRQGDIAEANLRTIERAWLSVTFDHFLQPDEIGSRGIEFTIRNMGHSAAFIKDYKLRGISWGLHSSIIPNRPIGPEPSGELPTKFVLFPEQSMVAEGPLGFDLTDDMINGRCMFDVYGYVVYDDVFHTRHMTRFCQIYNHMTRGFDFPREAPLGYNDAD